MCNHRCEKRGFLFFVSWRSLCEQVGGCLQIQVSSLRTEPPEFSRVGGGSGVTTEPVVQSSLGGMTDSLHAVELKTPASLMGTQEQGQRARFGGSWHGAGQLWDLASSLTWAQVC